jgi:hypothetical protein
MSMSVTSRSSQSSGASIDAEVTQALVSWNAASRSPVAPAHRGRYRPDEAALYVAHADDQIAAGNDM